MAMNFPDPRCELLGRAADSSASAAAAAPAQGQGAARDGSEAAAGLDLRLDGGMEMVVVDKAAQMEAALARCGPHCEKHTSVEHVVAL